MVVTMFRIAHAISSRGKLISLLGLPYLVLYRVWVEWILGVEIPPATVIGPGLHLNHGQGLVINNSSVIGAHCLLRHGITIGNIGKGDITSCPTIGDNVEIGAGAVIVGDITVGDGAVIGANAVVAKDVAPGEIVTVRGRRPAKAQA